MKKYIKENLTPILLGFALAIIYMTIITLIENVIVKIALILNTL